MTGLCRYSNNLILNHKSDLWTLGETFVLVGTHMVERLMRVRKKEGRSFLEMIRSNERHASTSVISRLYNLCNAFFDDSVFERRMLLDHVDIVDCTSNFGNVHLDTETIWEQSVVDSISSNLDYVLYVDGSL